ncbi:MAG: imidazole glycerol phosphate synthase subunit HisH [Candidatus Margulisiibacteriota bacterium]|jgi:glutamine amidotransferase
MITIIDYGMGNLRSVQKALERAGAQTRFSTKAEDLATADAVVLPGVGAFGAAMRNLQKQELIPAIKDFIKTGKPFLGICLGLQVLFTDGEEDEGVAGLNVFAGTVKRFPFGNSEFRIQNSDNPQSAIRNPQLKIPHMGWNQLIMKKQSAFLYGITSENFTYFVHSYYAEPQDKNIVLTTTDYGGEFCSAIQKDNVIATQFHPEKSGDVGGRMLRNWVGMVG